MSIYVFSTLVLSLVFMTVFGAWWEGHASFMVHISALSIVLLTTLAGILMIAIFPLLKSREAARPRARPVTSASWGTNISSTLSTPAAVIDGYNLVFANKAFLTEIGMTSMADDLIGMPFSNIVHPSDQQTLARIFAENVQADEAQRQTRLRLLCRDGTILPAYVTLSPLRDTANPNLNLLQFSSSTSPRLAGSDFGRDFNYPLLLMHIEQAVFQINVAQDLIYLNPSWEQLLDYKVEESIGKPLLAFIHPEDKPSVEAHLISLIQGKRNSCLIEARAIARNGDSCWIELRAQNTSTYKGERSSVIGTLTDIRRMKQTEARLRANRRSLSTLLSNVPGMIYRCKNDRNWTFEFVSDGCKEVTGYEPYEVIDNPNFSYTLTIHPDDRAHAWQCVQQQIARQEKFQMIYRITTRTGNVKWVWEQGRGVFSSAGELLALEGFITDIARQGDDAAASYLQQLFAQEQDM